MHSGEMLPSRRRRIPSIHAHVLYTLETWSFHVSVLLNISPRCLFVLTWGMGTPFIRTSGLCFAVLPIARCLLLGALKSMPHLSAHEAAVSRSELRRAQLDMLDLSAVCNVVSSAKIEHWLWVDSGRSLIKIRKSTGPRTVPCGIPDFGVSGADVVPSKRTHCSLCVRKLANHSVADELNPIKESLLNSPGIDTRS